jgi:hypothetical protein
LAVLIGFIIMEAISMRKPWDFDDTYLEPLVFTDALLDSKSITASSYYLSTDDSHALKWETDWDDGWKCTYCGARRPMTEWDCPKCGAART